MKILVVDDHPLIVHALEQVLPDLGGGLEILAAVNRDETITMLARHPDCALVLLDLALPGAHGLDLLAELRRSFPRLPVVVLSATHDQATIGVGARRRRARLHRQDCRSGQHARRGAHRARRRPSRHARRRAPRAVRASTACRSRCSDSRNGKAT